MLFEGYISTNKGNYTATIRCQLSFDKLKQNALFGGIIQQIIGENAVLGFDFWKQGELSFG